MHTITISFGAQSSVYLQFQTRERAQAVHDKLTEGWALNFSGDFIVGAAKDEFNHAVVFDYREVKYIFMTDIAKDLDGAVQVTRLQQAANERFQRGASLAQVPTGVVPFPRQ